MQVIVGPRASGKTTELIKLANEHRCVLAVHSQERKRQVEQHYPEVKAGVITWRELKGGHRGMWTRGVVIDDIDMLLRRHFSDYEVLGFAMTGEGKCL